MSAFTEDVTSMSPTDLPFCSGRQVRWQSQGCPAAVHSLARSPDIRLGAPWSPAPGLSTGLAPGNRAGCQQGSTKLDERCTQDWAPQAEVQVSESSGLAHTRPRVHPQQSKTKEKKTQGMKGRKTGKKLPPPQHQGRQEDPWSHVGHNRSHPTRQDGLA